MSRLCIFDLFISVENLKLKLKRFFKLKVKPNIFLLNCLPALVVKTHNYGITTGNRRTFEGAVLLVRDPFDAILAEFNRLQSMDHVGHARGDVFQGKGWSSYVRKMVPGCRDKLYKYMSSQKTDSQYKSFSLEKCF